MRHKAVISEAIGRLRADDIMPLIFKGTALAYRYYGEPARRTRGDTDILVPTDMFGRSAKAIVSANFDHHEAPFGDLISYQESFSRDDGHLGVHQIDLHHKLTNIQLLANAFPYEELRESAIPLPGLHADALMVGPVHSLLIACFHSVFHSMEALEIEKIATLGPERLIWLYDVHLLADAMNEAAWDDFIETARKKGLCAISVRVLVSASRNFRTDLPTSVRVGLDVSGEPAFEYLTAGPLRRSWMELRAVKGGLDRTRFVIQSFLPPSLFMRRKYAGARVQWLPWLYARRASEGILRRIRSLMNSAQKSPN